MARTATSHSARNVSESTVSAVIALGANLGDREQTISTALKKLAAEPGIKVDAVSSLYESAAVKPEGVDVSAPAYLNAVALVTTSLAPPALLDKLLSIETAHGRVRTERWGDRTLDLDLITYGNVRLSHAALTLPHPRAHQRSFVIVPWLECDPAAALPVVGLLAALPAAHDDSLRIFAASPSPAGVNA